jgi:hypothetical protein
MRVFLKVWQRPVVVAALAVALSQPVWATMRPLGMEIGQATLAQAKSALANARWREAGINKWNGGRMYEISPDATGIEGLQSLTAIFSPEGRLVALLMTLDKSRLRDVLEALRTRYKVEAENIPFVGDASARFRSGNTLALVEAPHLSFNMTVSYLTDDFYRLYQKSSTEEEVRRKREQASKF